VEIAERRVSKAESQIVSRLHGGKSELAALGKFRRSQNAWRICRKSHCDFANATVDLEDFNGRSFSDAGFCMRRVTEQRATELENILNAQKMSSNSIERTSRSLLRSLWSAAHVER
jgi:uncharacterized protein YecT (DUF1311 family)